MFSAESTLELLNSACRVAMLIMLEMLVIFSAGICMHSAATPGVMYTWGGYVCCVLVVHEGVTLKDMPCY